MEGNEGLEAADGGATDEDGGSSGGGGGGGGRRKGGDLVVVQFDDGGVDADGGEELLHDVAHAARGTGEDDNGVLRYESLDSFLRGFLHVDGQRGGGGGGDGGGGGGEVQVDDVV